MHGRARRRPPLRWFQYVRHRLQGGRQRLSPALHSGQSHLGQKIEGGLSLAKVTQISAGAWQISLPFLGEEEIIGSYLLAGENELAIIDPGPASTLESLLKAIRATGFDPQDVTHILLTHVHLDHAGATGSLVRQLPKAQVYVHSKGAPHLIDTSKVVVSATRIYGERMRLLWGEIESTPEERLHSIEGGDILKVAG